MIGQSLLVWVLKIGPGNPQSIALLCIPRNVGPCLARPPRCAQGKWGWRPWWPGELQRKFMKLQHSPGLNFWNTVGFVKRLGIYAKVMAMKIMACPVLCRLAWGTVLRTFLETCSCEAWEPCLKTWSWEPFLGTFSGNLFPLLWLKASSLLCWGKTRKNKQQEAGNNDYNEKLKLMDI